MERDIPDFNIEKDRLPYKMGEVPREGWFVGDVEGVHEMYDVPSIMRDIDGEPFAKNAYELIDELAFKEMEANLDMSLNGGNGPILNQDHLIYREDSDTKAMGWIKALHAFECPDTGKWRLAWYAVLSDEGHSLINGGHYYAWSTECPYAKFRKIKEEDGKTYYSPTYLEGAALTNRPRHEGQTSQVNSKNPRKIYYRLNTNPQTAFIMPDQTKEEEEKITETTTVVEEEELRKNDDTPNVDVTIEEEKDPNDSETNFVESLFAMFGMGEGATYEELFNKIKEAYDYARQQMEQNRKNRRGAFRDLRFNSTQKTERRLKGQSPDTVTHKDIDNLVDKERADFVESYVNVEKEKLRLNNKKIDSGVLSKLYLSGERAYLNNH